MLAVRGLYDGKTIRALPSERLPEVKSAVPVTIIFLGNFADEHTRQRLAEVARQMRARRARMRPLGERIKDLIEAGRDR
jgi:hypothetical protein